MSFRSPDPIEFDDVDLFVLAGPTGAGKSAVIDAMVFALYGQIPRLQDARLKEPVINRTAEQARVRFDFAVGDDRYRTAWTVKRTGGGGASSEAVLERVLPELDEDGEHRTRTLEHSSREVPKRIEQVLGLTFDEFVKTVVLPQGAFAELLHGDRQERQEMMVRLLGLDVYRDIGQDARTRAATHRRAIEAHEEQLEELSEVTEDTVDAASSRLKELQAVKETVDNGLERLEELREAYEAAEREAADIRDKVEALAGLERPDGINELADELRTAKQQVEDAGKQVEELLDKLESARSELEGFPAAAEIAHARTADDNLKKAQETVPDLEQSLEDARGQLNKTEEQHWKAKEQLDRAREHRDQVRRDDMAAALADGLHAGDKCPICRRSLDDDPDLEPPEGIDAADQAVQEAEAKLEKAEDARQKAATAKAAAATKLEGGRKKVKECQEALSSAAKVLPDSVVDDDDGLDREKLAKLESSRKEAASAVTELKNNHKTARTHLKEAEQQVSKLSGAEKQAWEAFTGARDTVAAYDAPQPGDVGIADAWDELIKWATGTLKDARSKLENSEKAVEEAHDAGVEHGRKIVALVQNVDVEARDDDKAHKAAELLAAAIQKADTTLDQAKSDLQKRKKIEKEVADLRTKAIVAGTLGHVLRADRFEQWLLTRLSRRLVRGASDILLDLTHSGYSIGVNQDDGSFEIIDHTNADERRSARTLSGGETFLASLSLALALAEHVAAISRQGAARLDALFLDEGFGTLDPASLDTVADAIEDLSSSQDRMVGVITHVRDLADRIPIRYEITKTADGSHIKRVEGDVTPAADKAIEELKP